MASNDPVAAAAHEGVGRSYLVEHSVGSGKSNTIAWLAHRLSSLHDERDERLFDSKHWQITDIGPFVLAIRKGH